MLYDVFVFKYIYMYSFNERLYLLAFSCILNAILRKFKNIQLQKMAWQCTLSFQALTGVNAKK